MLSRSGPEVALGTMRWYRIDKPIFRILACIAAVFAATALLYAVPLHDRSLTASFTFLILVLIVAAFWDFRYAICVSLLTALGFSWLLPPVGHFWLSDSRDVFTLIAFLIIGITAGYFSDRARREASNANLRRAEAVAAEQRFRDLVNSVEGIVWEADAATCAFLFVSDQAERILGYPTERWTNDPTFWKDHLHYEDRERVAEFCARVPAEGSSHDIEYRMIAADGGVVWLRDLVTVVVETGRPSRLRGMKIDITKRKQDEETLREQANLLTLTHDAIVVRDTNSTIKYWNRAAEEMYGWSAEEASGKISHNLLKTLFPIPLEQIEAKIMSAGRWEGELAHTRKDGTPMVVASRWSLQQDNQGTPVAILEINNDITEQKRAEQARQEIEEQFKAAFESNPTMYFIIDAAGKIGSVNTFGAEQLGYSVRELVGQPVLNIFYEPDRDAVQKHADECFEQPGRMMRWEARKIRKDGTILWVRETANAVFLKNRPVLLVICEDITEQKHAEEAARRSEKEHRDLIESVPAMVFIALPGPSNVFVSRGWREYTGLSSENTAGFGWQNAVHPEDTERFMEKWRVCSATGEPFEDEARFRRAADGEYRWFLVRAVALRDEHGNALKWYGILTDIEDRKRAEALLTGEKRILEMVAKGDSLAQILDSLCRLVEEQASGVLASILLVDGNRLRHGGAPSLPKAYTDAIDGVIIGASVGSCGTAAYTGKQVLVKDIATDPLWADYREAAMSHSLRACWSTPIFSMQGTVIATFAMYYREPRSPSLRDQEIIEQITHLAGVAIERKQTQEALQRSEANLAEAQRLTKTGSWAYNPFSGRTGYWSEEMFRIFGLDPHEDPSSEKFWNRVHPEDVDRVRERVEREAHEKKEYVDEYRIVLPDGTVKHILDIGHPDFNHTGDVIEFVGTTVDITERKRAEHALRESEELKRRIIESSTDCINVLDLDGNLLFMSSGGQQLLEIDNIQSYLNNCWIDFWRPEDRPQILESLAAAKAGEIGRFQAFCPSAKGAPRWWDVITTSICNADGQPEQLLSVSRDITERKRAEEELHAAETRFRTYVDHATDVLFVHDEQGKIVDMNRQASKSLGYTREELIGAMPDLFDPNADTIAIERIRERLEAGELAAFESTNRRKDGTTFPVEVRVSPFLHGGHRFSLSVARDISERKRAEQELRRSESYLAEAQRLTRTGSLAWDPASAKTLHCSDEVFRMFGLDPQKGIPAIAELLERVYPEDREYVAALSRRGADDKAEHVVDYRLLLSDGILKYIHSIRHPVLNDAGEIAEFLGTLIDVTEQKRAEDELHAAETRFRISVDHLTDAIFIHDDQDNEGRIIDVNQRACDSLGYTREELIGMTAFDYDPSLDATFNLSIKERLARGEIFSFERVHRRKDGTEFPVEVRVRPFWHGDHRFGLGLVRDISERKRAEAERERLRQIEEDLARMNRVSMMGELTASLAHEIKQPIAAAVSNAEACLQWLARDQPDLAEVREAATEMVKEARRTADIVSRTRSLFKKEEMKREIIDLNQVIRDTVFLIREEADRRSISVRIELDAELPRISGDPVQLQQVLINLVLNGLEAMNGTAAELVVRSQRHEEGRPMISVSDAGIGLPVGESDKIFDAFFTTKPQGTGMGLAISRSIVESHGGRLWAAPNPGQGTTFHFTVPSELAEGA